jgi:hypothetical protein
MFFFPDIPRIPSQEEQAAWEDNLIKRLVARFSRGNVSLGRGLFFTSQDAERQRNKLKNYEF